MGKKIIFCIGSFTLFMLISFASALIIGFGFSVAGEVGSLTVWSLVSSGAISLGLWAACYFIGKRKQAWFGITLGLMFLFALSTFSIIIISPLYPYLSLLGVVNGFLWSFSLAACITVLLYAFAYGVGMFHAKRNSDKQ